MKMELNYFHFLGIAHRDLKPSNILTSNEHYSGQEDIQKVYREDPIRIKITDLGESRTRVDQTRTLLRTRTTNILRGSPGFMAPELYPGKQKYISLHI